MVFVDELQPGDVLLMMGNAEISKVIAWCSDSEYSHAAIVADRGRLLEAHGSGARYVDIDARVRNTQQYLCVRAARPHDRGGHPFSGAEQALLLMKIATLEHAPYPLGDILTLGMAVAARRKLIEDERLRTFVAMLLDYLVERSTGAMSCSELVYRALAENAATPQGRLAPVILIPERKQGPHRQIDLRKLFQEFCDGMAQDEEARRRFEWFCKHFRQDDNAPTVSPQEFAQTLARFRQAFALGAGPVAGQPDPNPNPRLVQPEDLAASPSCTMLGDVRVRGE